MAGRWQGPIERYMFVAEMSLVRVYIPLNPDIKCLGTARTSDVPMLDRTVTVGHEEDETFVLYHGSINIQPTNNE
jgi:hypothetical protein